MSTLPYTNVKVRKPKATITNKRSNKRKLKSPATREDMFVS